jgi:hypothetical protein
MKHSTNKNNKSLARDFAITFISVASAVAIIWFFIDKSNPEATIERHIRAFEKEARSEGYPLRVRNVTVKVGPLDRYTEGHCRFVRRGESGYSDLSVVLNSTYWEGHTSSEQEQLVFHELGHCILHREHNFYLRRDDERPESIMYPSLVPRQEYEEHRATYIAELFKNAY